MVLLPYFLLLPKHLLHNLMVLFLLSYELATLAHQHLQVLYLASYLFHLLPLQIAALMLAFVCFLGNYLKHFFEYEMEGSLLHPQTIMFKLSFACLKKVHHLSSFDRLLLQGMKPFMEGAYLYQSRIVVATTTTATIVVITSAVNMGVVVIRIIVIHPLQNSAKIN